MTRPNIVIVMADELRQDVLMHTYRNEASMPNCDRLREEGVTFENCFCQTPTCCPSRGSFITGKYPHQLQLWNHSCVLPPEERTMGHHFGDNGYDTVAFGKTHNMCPGFRSVTYDLDAALGSTNHGYNVSDDDCVGTFDGPEDDFCDFVACRQFDSYLDAPGDEPFLAHIGLYSPHPPLYPPQRFAQMYDWRDMTLPSVWEDESTTKPNKQRIPRRRWDALSDVGKKKVIATGLGMSTMVDECIGRIMDSLRRHRFDENTIVIVTSDHGDMMGDHGMLGKFYNHYEEALKVPLIVRLPGNVDGGTQCVDLVEMLDVYPTLCDVASVPTPEEAHALAGQSLIPAMKGEADEHREYVFSQIEEAYMVRTHEWKFVYHIEDQSELYNLKSDPEERQNLFGRPEFGEIERDLLIKMMDVLGAHRRAGFNRGQNDFFG